MYIIRPLFDAYTEGVITDLCGAREGQKEVGGAWLWREERTLWEAGRGNGE